ncbi:MAG: hypothetical protein NC408_07050 [Candidatus Gastranaerophilales bacterium]|nr:hypothetical protein [Candidatus Gastranaerophilales bacterium]MCM1073763.1 hypothetical protein [Bacteroides sp.]
MFEEIVSYIARTNLFNFIIFLSIIIYLAAKMDVRGKLEASRETVESEIEESKTVKAESETRLTAIEESMAHIEEEIESILTKSEENAKLVGEKIVQDAEKNVIVIRDNAGKAIENSRMILKNDLIKKAALASVEVAKSQILNELNANQGLHDKLIEESINAIEGVQL